MGDPIKPERLMVQARTLAGVAAGRGRPSPTDHRRAVSTAYYALFHALISAATHKALPAPAATDDDRLRAARWFDHTDVKNASQWVIRCHAVTAARTSAPSGVKDGVWELLSSPVAGGRLGNVSADVAAIARAFVDLQDARHAADYDHMARFPKATATRHVASAAYALDRLDALPGDAHLERYLALLVFGSRRLAK